MKIYALLKSGNRFKFNAIIKEPDEILWLNFLTQAVRIVDFIHSLSNQGRQQTSSCRKAIAVEFHNNIYLIFSLLL